MIDSMEKLLASQKNKLISVHRGQSIEGEVISVSDKEITLEIGAKSEGVLQSRDLPRDQLETLKTGDKLKAFVSQVENESGQIILTVQPVSQRPRGSTRKSKINWSRFIQAQAQKSRLQGKVLEINKGGLIVEVDNIRGFLPNSQIGFELMSKVPEMEDLLGIDLTVTVIEIDQENNRLIFSQRGHVSETIQKSLNNFKPNQKITGKIVAILPFGLIIDISGVEGIVFISDVSWEKVEDLSTNFKVGMEIEAQVIGIDDQLGRLNLSIKYLTEDPFSKLSEKYSADEVVKGEISDVSDKGITIMIDGIEGFLPASKMDQAVTYEVGKSITILVDSVDKAKRRINLAPLITSTAGLIYK